MNTMGMLNRVVEYIEEHITEEINMSDLAKIACCSAYNFQRMFSFIADMSVTEYIRNRRMSLCALELQNSDIKIIDIAIKYGYESPISFTRAFQTIHGVTPSEARKQNVKLKMFPKLSFLITVEGADEMNYRIVKTPPFKVFGMEGLVSTIGEKGYFNNEGEIWQTNHTNGEYERLFENAGSQKISLYDTMFTSEMCKIHALMNYKKVNDTTYGYMQCSFVVPDSKIEGYTVVEIPETTWVVLGKKLVDWNTGAAIGEMNKEFYSKWLPASEYVKADAPEFEMYGGTSQEGYVELWLPIKKK